MKHIILIDNYDSFTYNLVQYFQMLGAKVTVFRNDEATLEDIQRAKPDGIVFSPGPGTVERPEDIGICPEVYRAFSGIKPVLGVCLGMQMMGYLHGGTIERVTPRHGKTSLMRIVQPTVLFEGLENPFEAMRYHSLVVSKTNFPKELTITALSEDDDQIMALEIPEKHIYGVQFHPESIGTKVGMTILDNFIKVL